MKLLFAVTLAITACTTSCGKQHKGTEMNLSDKALIEVARSVAPNVDPSVRVFLLELAKRLEKKPEKIIKREIKLNGVERVRVNVARDYIGGDKIEGDKVVRETKVVFEE